MHNYFVETDSAGWPKGLADESKKWLIDKVTELLKRRPMLLYEVVHFIRLASDQPTDFKKWVLQDAIYCAVERALREVAEPKWTLRAK